VLAAGDSATDVVVYGGEPPGEAGVRGWASDVQGAVATAREVLLFVDGAVEVRPGAIAAALAAMSRGPVGAVVGRLLRPDGGLAEAGGIVWADGSVTVYAPERHEETGEAMFRRDVDWGSRRFLLVRRSVFEAVGGFAAGFEAPAMADADLCERIWAAGWRVVFDPLAVAVLHGPEAASGSVGDQKRLRLRALHRGRRVRYPAAAANVLVARDASARGRRVLLADGVVPLNAVGAGYPRTQAILNEAVAMGWFVTFLAVNPAPIDWTAAQAELAPEIEITAQGPKTSIESFLRARRGYYDVVMVSRPDNMNAFTQLVRSDPGILGGARLVYDAEALFVGRAVQAAKLHGTEIPPEQIATMIRDEMAQTAGADAVIAVTPAEAAVFREGQPVPVSVVSHLVEPRTGPPHEARSGFLFIGRLLEPGSPNWEGLAWFVQKVWPLIRAELGDVTLEVVGALHPDGHVLGGPGVNLHGAVADLRPFYDRARLFVSPTRYAAGVSIKVLEAVEAGVPVLTTALIASQLGWVSGQELLATDDAGEMAFQAIEPYRLERSWIGLQVRASARLEAEHGRARFRAGLREAWGA